MFRSSHAIRIISEILMITCFTLIASQPLWYGSLMRSDEGLLHLYRLVALDQAVQHGDVWPRYVPTLLFGYGLPLFNFYSPASLYPSELLYLAGLDFIRSLIGGLIFYQWLGAMGAYQLGKGWGGVLAGIGTAVAYLYAPSFLNATLSHGALDESAGLALLPWLLWATHQLARHGRRRDFIAVATSLILLILSHTAIALYGLLILILYALALWWTGQHPPRFMIHISLVISLALGIAAFFWLPALLETETLQPARIGMISTAGFRSLTSLLTPPPPADLSLFNRTSTEALSWPALLLALAGGGLILWHPPAVQIRSLRAISLTLSGLAGLLLFSLTPASIAMWASLPTDWQTQFQYRATGPISLIFALLAGIGLTRIAERPPAQGWIKTLTRLAWISLCTACLILYSLPWLYQLYIPDPPARGVLDVQDFERQTGHLGTTARADILPRWVRSIPNPKQLIGLYQHGDAIPRLQPLNSISLQQAQWGPTSALITFSAASDATLTFDWVYYPGWWATLDGEPAAVFPTHPGGLLGINVPPGQHDLEIGFESTPLQLGAMITSGIALAVLLGMFLVRRLWPEHADQDAHLLPNDLNIPALGLTACATAVVILVLKITLIDNLSTPFQRARFASGIEQGTQHPVQANFGGQLMLLGYDLRYPQTASGSPVDLNLYWQLPASTPAEDLTSQVFLVDSQGTVIASNVSYTPGGWPSHSLLPGFYIEEQVTLKLPPGTPPGDYPVKVSLTSQASQSPLSVIDTAGNSLGPLLQIGSISVTRPAWPASLEAFKASLPDALLIDQMAADGIRLVGILPPPARAEIGQTFMGLALWQADRRIMQEYQMRVLWLDDLDQIKGELPPRDLVVNYPTSQWGSGDRWRGAYPLSVPGRLNLGTYRVALEVLDTQGVPAGPAIVIGQMMVTAPVRTYHPPETDFAARAIWSNSIHLMGYDIESLTVQQGDGLRLALIWQTETDLYDSLTVSIQLVDAQGKSVTMQDSIPVGGRRPTTSWSPGEFVTDRYALFIPKTIPTGRYQIQVGWYNAATGQRILLANGSDGVLLPQAIYITAK